MQISSKKGSMVLDFYPIKDWNENIIQTSSLESYHLWVKLRPKE